MFYTRKIYSNTFFNMCLETCVGGRGEKEGEEEQNRILLA